MKHFFIFLILTVACKLTAQDVIYTSTGLKIETKVLEISATEIRYKDFTNVDGPTYVILNTDVVIIKFSNGTTQVITENPVSYSPKATEVVTAKPKIIKPKAEMPSLYYLHPNLLSINALALANGDFSLIYDREFLNNKLALTFLGGYNFNTQMGNLNAAIIDSRDRAKKNYDLGVGVNFMPRNTKRVQYFVGILAKYMSYSYYRISDTTSNQLIYTKANGYQLGIMLTNGWLVRISSNFNFKLFASIGVPINSPNLNPYSSNQTSNTTNNNKIRNEFLSLPKIYLGYCFGYRF